jgi:GTPase SAR1 family protein
LLLYDITNISFSNIKTWIEERRECASPHVVAMLIGNKTGLDALRVIPADMAEAFAASFLPPPRFLSMNPKRRLLRSALLAFGCPIFSLAEDGMMYMETSALSAFNADCRLYVQAGPYEDVSHGDEEAHRAELQSGGRVL